MRLMFQAGCDPRCRDLYDPFDAMLSGRGAVKGGADSGGTPGMGAAALRAPPEAGRDQRALEGSFGSKMLGGSLLIIIFEGEGAARAGPRAHEAPLREGAVHVGGRRSRAEVAAHRYSGELPAGARVRRPFSDTMEVAAPWSKLGALYDGVRRALGEHVFVMAHLSHAYPGRLLHLPFAGTAAPGPEPWDTRCENDVRQGVARRACAAVEAGGTLAHHHGAGALSKAPRLGAERPATPASPR